MEDKIKIIIELEGGLIKTIWATAETQVDITIIDHDREEDEEPVDEEDYRSSLADLEDLKESGEIEEVY